MTNEQTDIEAADTEVDGPKGQDRIYWLLAGGLFALAGVFWLFSSNSAAIGILFIVVGLAFVGLSSGFVRRR